MGKRIRNFFRDVLMILIFCAIAAFFFIRWYRGTSTSNDFIRKWLTDAESYPDYETSGRLRCGDAPFIIPSEGFIGLLWRDTSAPYNARNRHTGIDIFGSGAVGTVPIYAAYDGYLTRLDDWQATVIIRHDDPLQAGRRIWTYYTHMASIDGSDIYISDEFPQGTSDKYVEQGTLCWAIRVCIIRPSRLRCTCTLAIVTSESQTAGLRMKRCYRKHT